jgi:hypothetical protein
MSSVELLLLFFATDLLAFEWLGSRKRRGGGEAFRGADSSSSAGGESDKIEEQDELEDMSPCSGPAGVFLVSTCSKLCFIFLNIYIECSRVDDVSFHVSGLITTNDLSPDPEIQVANLFVMQ